MGEKLVIGPFDKGFKNNRTPFNIDNDSFPVLINAYQWRGRVKRKRGTSLLNRLRRFFNSLVSSYGSTTTITLNGSGVGNILTGFSLQTNGNIEPETVNITIGANVYTDDGLGNLLLLAVISGSINYATGSITIAAEAGNNASAFFNYYPDLPVMGLRDFITTANAFPETIGFDTVYSYNILTTQPYNIYDVSFYKNLVTGTYPLYVQKTNWTATSWNGQDYQQFWTVNYQGALWATNGIEIPFDPTNVGMQYAPSADIAYVSNTPTTLTVTIAGSPLVVGDFVFVNEWTGANATTLNYQSGYVTAIVGANITITFPNAAIGAGPFAPGIIQYLTSRSDVTKDSLRWYDGDPTTGDVFPPVFQTGKGWVNFAPPLNNIVRNPFYSIAELPPAQYYLVGARMIIPFKDRLLFIGPVVQTSAANSQIYLQDTIIYSQNGTPYYTASFTGSEVASTTVFTPILTPTHFGSTVYTATAPAYFGDVTGFGGFISAGLDEPINTVSSNEDVLILGFDTFQIRFVYTGNDIVPFNFFIVNSELGSSSTFSAINFDRGVLARGSRGYTMTSQTEASRIDIDIPDQVFEVNLQNNGVERFTSQRDFIKEWVYYTYPSNKVVYKFPNQTLFYNYRDNSWAIFNECYTTYGQFRRKTGFTWGTIGNQYETWGKWNETWGAGASTLLQPEVIAGNQQGFVIFKDAGTDEDVSLYIRSFANSTLTVPDHCLNNGDYIIISGCIGTIAAEVNGKVFSVMNATTNTITLNPNIGSGTYVGGGLITRCYVPFIQTKQFPSSWGLARKTRLGPQQYLLTTTNNAQITLLIYLSQNADDPYNDGPIIPATNTVNDSLIYSTILYTCPESTNLGLTPANINLQMPTAVQQQQIWHRMNTSLIGDTIQLGFTLNDTQMRDENLYLQFAEIELHGAILDLNPSQILA